MSSSTAAAEAWQSLFRLTAQQYELLSEASQNTFREFFQTSKAYSLDLDLELIDFTRFCTHEVHALC